MRHQSLATFAAVLALFLMRANKIVKQVNEGTNGRSDPPPRIPSRHTHTHTHTHTHHHVGTVAEAVAVVVGGDDLEGEVGAAHVAVVDGRLDDARVRLDHEAVVGGALFCWRDDQPVCHGAVVPGVCVGGLWWV